MKYQQDLLITKREQLSLNCFLLCLQSPNTLGEILPGQFVNVLVEDIANRILRRPISIHDVDYNTNTITIVVQSVGQATKKLSTYRVGEKLNVVFPLGNSFPINENRPLLIGGGVGIAPLYYLAKKYLENGKKVSILMGARSENQLYLIDKYRQIADLFISTEDGSKGEKGLVTQNSILQENFSAYITCGPTPMMRAINEQAIKREIPCFVSLENRMACGIGACLCCVTPTKQEGNVCVCTEGPVFSANDLKW